MSKIQKISKNSDDQLKKLCHTFPLLFQKILLHTDSRTINSCSSVSKYFHDFTNTNKPIDKVKKAWNLYMNHESMKKVKEIETLINENADLIEKTDEEYEEIILKLRKISRTTNALHLNGYEILEGYEQEFEIYQKKIKEIRIKAQHLVKKGSGLYQEKEENLKISQETKEYLNYIKLRNHYRRLV